MNRYIGFLLAFVVGCARPSDTAVVENEKSRESLPAITSLADAASERLTSLAIGDPAPPLQLGGFVKGEPFATFEPGKIYVVEFSATWCGPCRAAIPHLTELQKQYPDVTFLSVYVREEDRDAPRKFVDEMGERIGYRVAVDDVPDGADDGKGVMWRTWMEAAEVNGIPVLFVVDGTGRIIAITDPRIFEKPLAEIVAGTWNIDAAKIRSRDQVLRNRGQNAFDKRLEAILEPSPSPKMLKQLSDFKVEYSSEKSNDEAFVILWGAFRRFAKPDGNDDLVLTAAKELCDYAATEYPQAAADTLNGLAWEIVDPQRPQVASQRLLLFALDAARRADDISELSNKEMADTLARTLFLLGNSKLAFQAQQRAVRLALVEKDSDQHLIAELRVRLKEYAAGAGQEILDEPQP